jgi:hypothetical protein
MPIRRYARRAALALPALLAGCDGDNPGSELREVAGTYVFTELRFDPDAPALAEADVLANLDPGTEVTVATDGEVLFVIDFDGGGAVLIANGEARASSASLRLSAETEDDAEDLARVLLPQTFSLQRSGDDTTLSADLDVNDADLEAYGEAIGASPNPYVGLNSIDGTLHVTLERQ